MLSLTRCIYRQHDPESIPGAQRSPSVLLQLLRHVPDRGLRQGVYECMYVCEHAQNYSHKEKRKFKTCRPNGFFFFISKDSDHSSDDLSSGVFSSYNSQIDGHLEWLVSANQPSSYCFEGKIAGLFSRWMIGSCLLSSSVIDFCRHSHTPGVDIWIENIHGECLRIRERRQVKVGHVAIGISDQVRDS